jgi:hypothetical protein
MHRDKFLYTVGSYNMMEGAGFFEASFTAYMRNVLICGMFNTFSPPRVYVLRDFHKVVK